MLIYMRNVPGKPLNRMLTEPMELYDKDGEVDYIMKGFEWDGSSVPWAFIGLFPRMRHPVASVRHDYRCRMAKSRSDRKFADSEFRKDVDSTSWKLTSTLMYFGVRVGSWFKRYD
jgi:hypothetical protein